MSVPKFTIDHNAPSQSRAATQRKHRSTTQNHADIVVIKIVLSVLRFYAQLQIYAHSHSLSIGDHQRAIIYLVNEEIQTGCGCVLNGSLGSQEGNVLTFQGYRIYIGGYRQGFS